MSLFSRNLVKFCNLSCKNTLNLSKNHTVSTTKYLRNGYYTGYIVASSKLSTKQTSSDFTTGCRFQRSYSSDVDDGRPKRTLPTLMDFPEVLWPSMLKTIRNWIMVNFIIRPYFDNDFNMPDLIRGTRHALQVIHP